jgi:molecular chaperone HscB
VLGLPRSYALDSALAEDKFRELSRQFHPDRFAKADPRARRASLQRSVQLNEAWRTVKDPIRRAAYLLQLGGYELGGDDAAARPTGVTAGAGAVEAPPRKRIAVSPELLGDILELREELADARAGGDDARVQALAAAMRERVEVALGRIGEALGRAESTGPDSRARDSDWERAAGDLIAIRYFRRFLDEVAAHDEDAFATSEGDAAHA